MTGTQKRILILGGTVDARAVAESLVQHPQLDVISSLAGRTQHPVDLPGRTRRGGFGGAKGLQDYLESEDIGAVIDATHPFAVQMSENAEQACAAANVPRLYLARPAWTAPLGANTTYLDTFTDAARHVSETSSRAFLTIGGKELNAFINMPHVALLVRTIETPDISQPLANCTIIQGRPPFSYKNEHDLMTAHAIDTLVTKDSSTAATAPKITAAADLGLEIVMIRRPAPPTGETVITPDDAVRWALGAGNGLSL